MTEALAACRGLTEQGLMAGEQTSYSVCLKVVAQERK